MTLRRGSGLKRKTPLRSKAEKKRRPRDTGPDRTTRDLVLERDSGCVMCGAGPYGLQVHHRKPRKMGGRTGPEINSPANLVSLCPIDHWWVESSRAEALDMGLLLLESDDPAASPVVHRLYGVAYLQDDGSVQVPLPWDDATIDRLVRDLKSGAAPDEPGAAPSNERNINRD